jgi:hypothetical protein
MENNNVTQSLSNTIDTATNNASSSFSIGQPDSGGGGFLDTIKNLSITTWIIIILILSFLGFNIFSYLEKGTETLGSLINPVLKFFASITGNVVGKASNETQNIVQNIGNTNATDVATANVSLTPSQNVADLNVSQSNTLNTALNSKQDSMSRSSNGYQEDDINSNIQSKTSKSGWCYIGEDRGFRSCSEVGPSDECMSGDIFPSNEICMNPSLRS